MPVEFIGMIATARVLRDPTGPSRPVVDPAFTREFARAHEASGFDRVLDRLLLDAPPTASSSPPTCAAHTERLGVLLAHRPGFVAPTFAARKLATLDQFSGGRLALHVITGGSDAEQRRDGDYLDHDERVPPHRRVPRRSCSRIWTADGPFDHDGEFYRFEGAFADVPLRAAAAPADLLRRLVRRGRSRSAQARRRLRALGRAAGRRAAHIDRGAGAAAAARPRAAASALSFRPILGADRGRGVGAGPRHPRRRPASGQRRRVPVDRRAAERRLAAAAAARPSAATCTTAPVDADRDGHRRRGQLDGAGRHARAGRRRAARLRTTSASTTLLIRGYDPYDDAVAYGDIVTAVRAAVAARDERAPTTARTR